MKSELRNIFDIQWSDNVKARILDGEQTNAYRPQNGTERVRAQTAIYKYLKSLEEPQ
jgi:polyphosphate kinase